MSNPPPSSPVVALAPWTLKGTIYSFMFYISPSSAQSLQDNKSLLYSPLEGASSFSGGKLVGGLASVQVIRYTESPVGPYDEFILVPGRLEYEVDGPPDKDGNVTRETRRNLRVTRIYVSQEATCWNGRNNWNIPKHIAEFEFQPLANNAVRISVSPLESRGAGTPSKRAETPFFAAVYRPVAYAPSFPLSTAAAKYVGLDLTLVQPPLPDGKDTSSYPSLESGSGSGSELVGTEQWCSIMPHEWSSKTSLGWWDLKRRRGERVTEEDALLDGGVGSRGGGGGGGGGEGGGGEEGGGESGDGYEYENWWPGFGRWRIGLKMDDATIRFPEGRRWADVSPRL